MIAQAQFTISDLSDATAEVIVGTQTAATNAWTGNATFSELKDGQTILYWLPFAGTSSSATLNLTLSNGTTTGAVPVYINGTTRCSTHVAVGNITLMTYRENTPIAGSGNYIGWWINRNQDTTTNYYDRINYKASVTAVGAIAAGRLGVFNSAGKLMLLSTTPFDVTKPILYVGTKYTTSALTQTNNYISWGTAFSLASTVSGFSGTAGATVYIKGTLNGNMFTPAAGVLTTTVPTTEDGYTYILLGLMSTTVNAVLAPEHPMFRYYNGGFKTISQISYEAFMTAQEAQEAVDNLEIGGRNYILNSSSEISDSTALIARYALSEAMVAGDEYTISLTLTPMESYEGLTVRTSGGDKTLATIDLSGVGRQIVQATFIAEYASGKSPDDDPDNGDILIYRKPASAGTASTIIHQIKLEKGNRATDWTAAPEDAEEVLEQKLSGVTGSNYAGAALGTFDGSFFGNSTAYQITGTLFNNMAAYISQGNNTFTIYNPSPSASSQGYSYNYLQWSAVTITITYEEAVSQPSTSASSVNMGSAVTIYTNRVSTSTTHTLLYTFGNTSGTIATNVGASVNWTPALTLAAQIPNATNGTCTITCQSYNGGTLTGTRTCTITLNVPATVAPSISSVTVEDTVTTVASRIGAFVKSLSKLSVAITAAGTNGSTVSSYRTSLDGVTYTTASFTASKKLSTAGNLTLTVTVTDSRGRTATYTETLTVLDYSYPSIRLFKADRCNADGSAAQVDGTHVRYSFEGGVVSLNNKNALACVVYYKLASAETWTQAETLSVTSYNLSETDKVLTQTFDALASYDLKVRLQDYFYYVEQAVSIGTKGVIMDFLADGTGIAFGKVAETSGYAEFGWPLKLSEPLDIESGGTGASTAAEAIAALGGVKKSGDTMTGNLTIQGNLYPSVYLSPYYNGTTNRTVFEGSYVGASSFASWEDSTGNNRRMLEVRTKSYAASLDNAVMLRVADAGVWSNYRVFHAGMPSGVPIANGGTGATTAANARSNLGANNASNINAGTLAMARLPFKVAYGSGNVAGNSALTINYSSAGFTSVPHVVVSYSTTGSNWSGDNGALKIYNKTATGATIIVGGSFNTSRAIDWIAIGT